VLADDIAELSEQDRFLAAAEALPDLSSEGLHAVTVSILSGRLERNDRQGIF